MRTSKPTLSLHDDNLKPNYSLKPDDNLKRDPYRLVGTILGGQYRLLEYAGGGGMGAVYRCHKIDSDSEFALKILKPDIVANNPIYSELFAREVEAARQLKHPNIVNLIDSGSEDNISFLVMEWLNGATLEDEIVKNPPDIARANDIFLQVCQAFAAAHEKNIIHLDIKPANIFVIKTENSKDQIKVIDFGLARVISSESGTTVTQFRGTHQYCSPEHYTLKVSHRSDIYSLGVLLYHLLTGVLPFSTSYIHAKMFPNLEMPPIPSVLAMSPNLPRAVDQVILKALSRNPNKRHQTVQELYENFLASLKQPDEVIKEPNWVFKDYNLENSPQLIIQWLDPHLTMREAQEIFMKKLVEQALVRNSNNISRAIDELGITRSTFYRYAEYWRNRESSGESDKTKDSSRLIIQFIDPTLRWDEARQTLTKEAIKQALVRNNYNISQAVDELGISQKTLNHYLKLLRY